MIHTMVLEVEERYRDFIEKNMSDTLVNVMIYLQELTGKYQNSWIEYDENGFIEIRCESLNGLHVFAKEIRLLERYCMNQNPAVFDFVSPRTQSQELCLEDEMMDDMIEFQDETRDLVYGMLQKLEYIPSRSLDIDI